MIRARAIAECRNVQVAYFIRELQTRTSWGVHVYYGDDCHHPVIEILSVRLLKEPEECKIDRFGLIRTLRPTVTSSTSSFISSRWYSLWIERVVKITSTVIVLYCEPIQILPL